MRELSCICTSHTLLSYDTNHFFICYPQTHRPNITTINTLSSLVDSIILLALGRNTSEVSSVVLRFVVLHNIEHDKVESLM